MVLTVRAAGSGARLRPALAGWRAAGIIAAANGVLVALAHLGLLWLGLLAAVLVPAGLWVAQRPQRGLLLMVTIAPFDGLLLLQPALQPLSAWKFPLVLGTLTATFLAPSARAPAGRARPTWVTPALALVGIGLVSAIVVGGFQGFTGFRLDFFYGLAAWTAWRCPLDARERDRLVTIFMVTGTLSALWGLIQQLLGPDRLHALGYEYNEAIRFTGSIMRSFGTFGNPFGLGFFLMVVLLIAVPHVLDDPGRLRNQIFVFASPICVLALLATVVRGAYLGLGVGLAYLAWHRYRTLLLLVPIGIVAVLLLPPEAFSSSSSADRATGWRTQVPVVASHPLGLGIGATGSAAEKAAAQEATGSVVVDALDVSFDKKVYQPDNYFVKTLLELGPIALWLLLLLFAGLFVDLRRAARRTDGDEGAFVHAVGALVIAAICASLVATYFELFPVDMLTWLLIGQGAAMAAAGPAQTPSSAVIAA